MRFFRRSEGPKEGDTWKLLHGTWSGKPTFVRFNETVSKRRDIRRKLKYELKIVVPIHHPNDNGFPTGEEADKLEAIEELLVGEIECIGTTVLVGIITSDGMREYAIYTDSPREVHLRMGELRGEVTSHDLQFAVQDDPDWLVYREIAGGL